VTHAFGLTLHIVFVALVVTFSAVVVCADDE
jgi:hypothetical protein